MDEFVRLILLESLQYVHPPFSRNTNYTNKKFLIIVYFGLPGLSAVFLDDRPFSPYQSHSNNGAID
jgi:hypothetical protein